jgi:hypothetical protein
MIYFIAMSHDFTTYMGNGNKINHGTWECSKIMGNGNVVKSWDMGM